MSRAAASILKAQASSSSSSAAAISSSSEKKDGSKSHTTTGIAENKPEIKGNRRGKKNEDPEVRHHRVWLKWRKALSQVAIRYRDDQLRDLRNFVFVEIKVEGEKKGKFSAKRRPADIAIEQALIAKRNFQLAYVVSENLRFQWRIGMNYYQMGDYYNALQYFENVSLKKEFKYETDEEKKERIKKEKLEEEAKKFEELQARLKKKKLKGRKAEEALQLEQEKRGMYEYNTISFMRRFYTCNVYFLQCFALLGVL